MSLFLEQALETATLSNLPDYDDSDILVEFMDLEEDYASFEKAVLLSDFKMIREGVNHESNEYQSFMEGVFNKSSSLGSRVVDTISKIFQAIKNRLLKLIGKKPRISVNPKKAAMITGGIAVIGTAFGLLYKSGNLDGAISAIRQKFASIFGRGIKPSAANHKEASAVVSGHTDAKRKAQLAGRSAEEQNAIRQQHAADDEALANNTHTSPTGKTGMTVIDLAKELRPILQQLDRMNPAELAKAVNVADGTVNKKMIVGADTQETAKKIKIAREIAAMIGTITSSLSGDATTRVQQFVGGVGKIRSYL